MSVIYQIGILVLILFLSFVLYQRLATAIDDYRYPPPVKLIDIGGYKLHFNASGQGDITVICDAGLSGTSLGWSLVQAAVSKFARVCSYDRAGYSWSDPSPLKRTSVQQSLTVIAAGIISNNEEGRKWKRLQKRLLSKSITSKQIVAENSNHKINHHQPEIIVDAIREMVNNHSS